MFKICYSMFLVSAKEDMARYSNITCCAFLSFVVESESDDAWPSVNFTKYRIVRPTKREQKRLHPF